MGIHTGWEDWEDKRHCISRNDKGQFVKGNFHLPKEWRENVVKGLTGRRKSKETRTKISNSLKGIKLSNNRKKNISIGTKRGMQKWSENRLKENNM